MAILQVETTQKLNKLISKKNIETFDRFATYLRSKRRRKIFEYCLNYTIQKNELLFRKTGEPNVAHPLRIALQAINYNLNYKDICAALLHDVIEDEVEKIVDKKNILSFNEKNKERSSTRKKVFLKFKKDFLNILDEKEKNRKYEKDLQDIINIVDILTRYRNSNPHYYYYIQSSFGLLNKRDHKNIIFKAILIKFLDRTDNIKTMDTELKKVLNVKIKNELRILDQIKSETIRKKYKKALCEQNSLLLDYSFSGGNRLNQIWKNTYLLIMSRLYFCEYKLYRRNSVAQLIEAELIKETIKVIKNHKNNLKIYLDKDIMKYWDNAAKTYNLMGGFEGRTEPFTGEINHNNQHLVFNSTLDIFSKFLLKNNKEFKQLQIDKISQYKYLTLIDQFLKEFEKNQDFVCDISQEITLRIPKIEKV